MKKVYKALVIIVVFSSYSCSQKTTTVTDSPEKDLAQHLTSAVLWYQTSAEMVASYYQSFRYGELMLDAKLDTMALSKPAAVVLDIDETVLDNSPYEAYLIKNNKQYSSSTWKEWTDQARAAALPGVLAFTKYAKSKGVQVFYISNRGVGELQTTIQNLKKHGFPNAEENFVLLKSTTSDKTERRSKVNAAYQVLVFLGDNLGDYDEIYANRGADYGKKLVEVNKEDLLSNFVILPNPMYGEWEKAIYNNDFSISTEQKLQKREQALIE